MQSVRSISSFIPLPLLSVTSPAALLDLLDSSRSAGWLIRYTGVQIEPKLFSREAIHLFSLLPVQERQGTLAPRLGTLIFADS